MYKLETENSKPVLMKNPNACRLLRRRALAEHRSLENAMNLTVEEALSAKFSRPDDTKPRTESQGGGSHAA